MRLVEPSENRPRSQGRDPVVKQKAARPRVQERDAAQARSCLASTCACARIRRLGRHSARKTDEKSFHTSILNLARPLAILPGHPRPGRGRGGEQGSNVCSSLPYHTSLQEHWLLQGLRAKSTNDPSSVNVVGGMVERSRHCVGITEYPYLPMLLGFSFLPPHAGCTGMYLRRLDQFFLKGGRARGVGFLGALESYRGDVALCQRMWYATRASARSSEGATNPEKRTRLDEYLISITAASTTGDDRDGDGRGSGSGSGSGGGSGSGSNEDDDDDDDDGCPKRGAAGRL